MRVIIILIISFCLFFNILSQNNKIKYPEIPENIISRSERMNYICVHFWDNTEFEDENILNDITGFKDFIYLLTHVPDSVAKIGVTNLLIRCMDNNAALSRVDDILKQYFDISFNFVDNTIRVNLFEYSNVFPSIDVTLFGIMISVISSFQQKQYSPILVTPSGIAPSLIAVS